MAQGAFTTWPQVSLVDLTSYLIFKTSFLTARELKAYKSLEGFKRYERGWLQEILGCQALDGTVAVVGTVKHSQRMNAPALTAWVHLTIDGAVISGHCKCMAGLDEVCSHVATILFALLHKANETSCTDQLAQWPVPRLKDVELSTIQNMTWGKESRSFGTTKLPKFVPEMNEEEIGAFLNAIEVQSGITPALSYITGPHCDRLAAAQKQVLNMDLGDLFEKDLLDFPLVLLLEFSQGVNISLSLEQVQEIEKLSRGQEGETWHRYRRGRVTASNFKSACTSSLESPAISTLKKICYAGQSPFYSAATSYGKDHEDVALRAYVQNVQNVHQDFKLRKSGLIIKTTHPMFGASPDAIVSCLCCGDGCVEVKCPFSMRESNISNYCAMKNACLEVGSSGIRLKKTHAYYYQIQLQLFVGDYKYVDFIVWSNKDMFVARVLPDSEFIKNKVQRAKNYHQRVILPELLGKAFTRNVS